MFKDYTPGKKYDRNFLFYKEWSFEAAQLMISCDDELQLLCREIPMNLDNVHSLKDYYESYTAEDMQRKISSLDAVRNLKSPMTEVEGGWIPDFNSRYFRTDFSYGINVIIKIADIFNVDTPTMDKIWNWYRDLVSNEETVDVDMSVNEFLKLYQ